MRRGITKEDIEQDTMIVINSLHYTNKKPFLGFVGSINLVDLMDAIHRATTHFADQMKGLDYIAKTLSFSFKADFPVKNMYMVDVSDLFEILPGTEELGLHELGIDICTEEMGLTDILNYIQMSEIASFTQTVEIIKRTIFKSFEFTQLDNKYKLIIQQAIILSIVTTSGLAKIENFYNEQYN